MCKQKIMMIIIIPGIHNIHRKFDQVRRPQRSKLIITYLGSRVDSGIENALTSLKMETVKRIVM